MTARYCPIHEYEARACGPDCQSTAAELQRANRALNAYWWHRRHGVHPLPYRSTYRKFVDRLRTVRRLQAQA